MRLNIRVFIAQAAPKACFKPIKVTGDGNCLFHALGHHDGYDGGALRIAVADFLQDNARARAPGLNGCMSLLLLFDFFLIFTNVTRLWTVDPGGHVMLKFQEPLDVSFVNLERPPEIYFFTSRAVSHIERSSPSHDPPFSIYFSFYHRPLKGVGYFFHSLVMPNPDIIQK